MIPHMRTTLTLDDDVFLLLGRRQSESGGTFKELVNGLLRSVLTRKDATVRAEPPPRVETRVFHGGTLLLGDVASTSELLALAEGEDHR